MRAFKDDIFDALGFIGYSSELTEKQKTEWELFFKSIGFVLPCKYCRESYKFF